MNNIFIYLIVALIGILRIISFKSDSELTNKQEKCIDCHGDLMAEKFVHPVAVDGCSLCHISTGEEHPKADVTGFRLSDEYPQLCYNCHDDKNSKDNVHYPVKDGFCSTCHSPHSSSNVSLIHSDFSENSCLDCHVMEIENKVSGHDPAEKGTCISCHDPHQSDYPRMIKTTLNDLCLGCHDRVISPNGTEINNIKQTLAEGNTIHDPISTGDCIICHLPHSSDYPRLLIGQYPLQQYTEAKVENFDICFMCHDSEMITADSTEYATNFRNGKLNLHYLHINGPRGRNCNLCHNAHGAPGKYLIEKTVKYGNWDMPMEAVFNENGGSCATGCHKKLEYSRH